MTRLFAAAALCLLTLAPSAVANADTIYLLNGRIIRTESVRIVDGQVIFPQLGGEVSIPLDTVLRIEKDARREISTPMVSAPEENAPLAGAGPGASDPAGGPSEAGSAGTSPGTDTPEYWIARIRTTDNQIKQVQDQLNALPLYDDVDKQLLRFNGQALHFIAEREKWDKILRSLQTQRKQLITGARRAGITPGALRDGLTGS